MILLYVIYSYRSFAFLITVVSIISEISFSVFVLFSGLIYVTVGFIFIVVISVCLTLLLFIAREAPVL